MCERVCVCVCRAHLPCRVEPLCRLFQRVGLEGEVNGLFVISGSEGGFLGDRLSKRGHPFLPGIVSELACSAMLSALTSAL